MQKIEVTAFISSNLALENFIFISVFFSAYRAFQIMDAKMEILSLKDILMIYTRKFIRLAPAYYGMWILLWGLTSRATSGPLWHLSNMTF
jgi:hypothetical protein